MNEFNGQIDARVGRLLRVEQIVGNRKKEIASIIPVSKSTWWAGVRSGRFPQPVKLGPRITVWREEDICALIEGASNERGMA